MQKLPLSSQAVKRVLRDLAEIKKNPIPGLSLCMPDINEPFTLHGNIEIRDGIYEGILIHLVMHIPEDYPIKPPAVNIAPGLKFGYEYHHHIYDHSNFGNSICTDLTSNFAGHFSQIDAKGGPVKSGWTPAYTLSSVLMQLQVFFADPDMPKELLPSSDKINKLKNHVKQYKLDIKTNNEEDGVGVITHSADKPYPPLSTSSNSFSKISETKEICEQKLYLGKKEDASNDSNSTRSHSPTSINSSSEKKQEIFEEEKGEGQNKQDRNVTIYAATVNKHKKNPLIPEQIKQEVAEKIICSVSKVSLFDSSKPIFGYPIDLEKDRFGRLWPTPIIELLSYDAFISNILQNDAKLDNYHSVKFTSSFGSQYNYWLPIYINDEHFERSKQYIFNAIAIIYAGVEGKKENDFQPMMVLKVLPTILVKTAIHFLQGTIYQSIAGIDCYCQLYRLFMKLVEVFPELQQMIDKEVDNFCKKEWNRTKKAAGELGDFMIKLSLSSQGLSNFETINKVLKEHFARQVSWAIKKDNGLLFEQRCTNFLERFMDAAQISNQFFLTKLEISRLLLDPDVKSDLEQRCGVLSEATINLFRERLSWIQENIVKDWSVFVDAIDQKSLIPNENVMTSYILRAFQIAKLNGYLS